MDARAELDMLLAGLFDGPPDAARNHRLDELLRTHPELQGEYLDFLQLHALLQWRGGKVPPASKSETPQPAREVVASGAANWRSGRSLAAALLVMAASIAVAFLWLAPEAQATPDVVDRLIELNLDLTQADSRDERSRIYGAQAEELKATLAKADLPMEERKLAESLLDNSFELTKIVDRTAEVYRFTDIADKLVARMKTATEEGDEKRIVQLADAYSRVKEVGVDANLVLASASVPMDSEKKKKLAGMTLRHATQTTQVAEIIERNPEPSRKVLHRAIKGHFHKTKKFKK